jgi:AraC family transcriptional regulator of adaptative response / DNA-3-methyladenine glycosylase II
MIPSMQAATPISIHTNTPAEDDACYLALKARDARFDGRFFTAVSSTGVYCRPVCRVRTPKRENCSFFALAAQAESAGYRPCLRCRPELAPGATPLNGAALGSLQNWSTQDASAILAQQAARLLDEPALWSDGAPSMADLATRLGVSERHVRRIFETHWGVSPLQYLQTRRLLMAKRLLTDTQLPVTQVAALSGFSSLRRFNASFIEHYRLQPRQLRKERGPVDTAPESTGIALKGAYRPPYDVAAMLGFFATRQIAGMERVDTAQLTLARTLSLTVAKRSYSGWVQARFMPNTCAVVFHISNSLGDALPQVLARLRAMLDLDAEPAAINPCMQDDFPGVEGLRVPGCLDGFELGVRAILGQQITVQAARTLGARLVERLGSELPNALPGLSRLFPTPQALAQATGEELGQMGIVRQRQRAIQSLAQAVINGDVLLQPGVDIPATLAALQALPGIGPWTAQYIAMRALRWPDAFVAGDVALQNALGVRTAANPQQAAEAASQRWKPWRSYAVVRAWASLATPPKSPVADTPLD